jgi:hypothetical protein
MGSAAKTKFIPRPPINQGGRDQRGVDKGKGRMDKNTRRKLRRKQLYFTCKEPWDLGHKCMGKGKAHFIEAISDDEDKEDFDHIQNMEENTPRIDPTCKEVLTHAISDKALPVISKSSTYIKINKRESSWRSI